MVQKVGYRDIEIVKEIGVDVRAISQDESAADNLEATYDGTGYNNDFAPAQQAQLSNIANTGAALNVVSTGALVTQGTEGGTTYEDTQANDGVHHVVTPTANLIDLYYEFDVTPEGVPVSCTISGRLYDLPPTSDEIDIFARDWVADDWQKIGVLTGINSGVDEVKTVILLSNHVGTGLNAGKVRIRFANETDVSLDADTTLNIDFLYCSYAVVTSAVGYQNGQIWIDTLYGTEGTVVGVNGVADNPCLLATDALALAVLTGMREFHIAIGSTITLVDDATGMSGVGELWNLEIAGQIITAAHIHGAHVAGDADVSSYDAELQRCHINTCSLTPFHAENSAVLATLTLLGTTAVGQSNTYILSNCYSAIAGSASPTFDFGVVSESKALNLRDYSGGARVINMSAGDTMSLEGDGQLIVDSCTGGEISIRGNFSLSGDSLGNVTITQDARYNSSQIDSTISANSDISAIQEQTDKLDNMIEVASAGNAFTTEALVNAPVGVGATPEEFVTALFSTIVAGDSSSTFTFEKLQQILAAWTAGNWRVKPSDVTKQELLDAADGTTIILEQSLSSSTPYKTVTVLI
jgi:hypothetical protein